MNCLYFFIILIVVSGSFYPVFALETPQACDTSILPHNWPSSHIYVTDASGNLPYFPLDDHTAIFHDDDEWNTSAQPRAVQVTLTIQDQYTGQLVFNQTQSLQMQPCSGPESVKWRFVPMQISDYIATVSDDRGNVSMSFRSIPDLPQEQLRLGVDSHNVVCRQDLQLVFKAEDGSPACVKPDTAHILAERGGLTVYDGKMKLLVSTDKTTEKNIASANPLGVTALVIYHPSLGCLGPCPPNNFYLKANSNSSAYLFGYDICDEGTCVKNNTLSVPLPANSVIKPQYVRVWLPNDIKWMDGDTVHIQLDVSSVPDSRTATLLDLGNSTIVP